MTENKKAIPFRRQYVLGPQQVDLFDSAKTYEVAPNSVLTAQIELQVTQARSEGRTLTLIGFLLDPTQPELNDQEILDKLLAQTETFEQLLKQTTPLAGKWALIYYSETQGIRVFNDIVGSRQVYYTLTEQGEFWAASQPHTLAKLTATPYTTDPDKLNFINSKQYEFSERAWLGHETLFDGIYHLLPNHYCAGTETSQRRFWPLTSFEPVELKQVVDEFAEILQGIMKSANHRKQLLLAISAGWDSRLLLAACKDIIEDCYCYVQKFDDLTDDSADIAVPTRLAKKLGFEFAVHETGPCPKDFNDAIEQSVAIAQSEKKKVLYYDFFKRFDQEVNMSGVVGEIFRSRFGSKRPLNDVELVDLFGRDDSQYALNMTKLWLENLKHSGAIDANINFWDLFYWEQYIGNWGVAGQAGQDIAIEEFFPLNCRALIELTYGLEALPYENSPLFLALMNKMWPEVLSEPINPKTKTENLVYLLKKILRKTGLFNRVKAIYFQLKNKTS